MTQTQNPTAAILVIGDEILTGRTREGNAHHLTGILAQAGFDTREIRVVADVPDTIIAALRALARDLGGAYDHVFTSGGIGPTHDDVTADAVAAAFGVGIEVNETARAAMQARYDAIGVTLNDNRLRMARIPLTATLIENEVSAAPGFSIGRVHVMAGVPEVFRAMVQALIPRLTGGRPLLSEVLEVRRGESDVAEQLAAVAQEWPQVSMGSYPFRDENGFATNLVVRGLDPAQVQGAFAALKDRLGL